MKRIILLLLIPLVCIACFESGMGIFYSIKEEQPLNDNETLPNDLTITGMAKVLTSYYVAAGALYQRDESSVEWATVATPVDHTFCTQIFQFSGNHYAVFASLDGTSSSLFSLSGVDTWTEIAALQGMRIVSAVASPTTLYITESIDLSYVTWYSSDGITFTQTTLSGQYAPVLDVAQYDALDWLISGKYLYSGTSGVFTEVVATGAPVSTAGFGGVFSSADPDLLFVTSSEGTLYAWDGITWSSTEILDSDDNPIPLLDINAISVNLIPIILVGSEDGYFELIFEAPYDGTLTVIEPGTDDRSSTNDNYLKITLRDDIIRFFFVDGSRLFACTSGSGLWINPIDDSGDPIIRKWDPE